LGGPRSGRGRKKSPAAVRYQGKNPDGSPPVKTPLAPGAALNRRGRGKEENPTGTPERRTNQRGGTPRPGAAKKKKLAAFGIH